MGPGVATSLPGEPPQSTLVVHHFGPDPGAVGGMASVIRVMSQHSVGADLVIAHPTWAPGSSVGTVRLAVESALALQRVPAGQVAHIHLSERGSFLREGLLIAVAHQRRLGTALTVHGASFKQFARRNRTLVAAVLRRADVVTCLDQETLEIVSHLSPLNRCEILPNPVVLDDRVLPVDSTDELVLFAGEIGLRKGADVMVQAWRLVAERRSKARCLIVGPVADFQPPAAPRLKVLAPVGTEEMRELLQSSRVVALPSRAEAMPMVLVEAMSEGRPFVGTPVGGVPELAEAGGLLAPVGDAEAVADQITELLANPERAMELGERGRRFCEQTRSTEVMDARFRELYEYARSRAYWGSAKRTVQ